MCNVKGRNDRIFDILDKKSVMSTGPLRPPARPPRGAAAQHIDFDPLRLPHTGSPPDSSRNSSKGTSTGPLGGLLVASFCVPYLRDIARDAMVRTLIGMNWHVRAKIQTKAGVATPGSKPVPFQPIGRIFESWKHRKEAGARTGADRPRWLERH
jgi:hypothetical protein